MAIFYNQPVAHRFGTAILNEIANDRWAALEIGVAWVRRSGTNHLLPALHDFLRNGKTLRITVGIDIQNTSQEGLEDLITLLPSGQVELYVYHDEAGTTFHPKVYLFHDAEQAKLIVGSNNLTEAGLFVNTEAGLEIEAPLTEPIIKDALAALASWRDPSRRLALPLDANLLRDLIDQGYVLPEAALRLPRRERTGTRQTRRPSSPLFGRTSISRPPVPIRPRTSVTVCPGPSPGTSAGAVGKALIMRVRKAHPIDRPTQTQLPKKVFEGSFFEGMTSITSAHDRREHIITPASARGIVNTYKVEIPEMRDFPDPVIRLERTTTGILYQAFDANSVLGQPILASLQRGLTTSPKTTILSKPSSPETSTWWRFI